MELLDGDLIEFIRVPYDAAASECKAAAFGYRIPPWMDRAYSLRKRLSRAPHRLFAMASAHLQGPGVTVGFACEFLDAAHEGELIECDGDLLKLTRAGALLSNEVFAALA